MCKQPSIQKFNLVKVIMEDGIIFYVDDELNIYSKTMRLLNQHIDSRTGYYVVTCRTINNCSTYRSVHRIIAQAFIKPNLTKEYEVHHKDRNRKNNNIDNLEVMTRYEHKLEHNLKYDSEKICEICGKVFTPNITKRKRAHVCSNECKIMLDKINAEKRKRPILQIDKETKEVIQKWESARDIQNELGFHESNINKCCNGHIKSCYGYVWQYA